jgi:hypothetical protein
MYLKNHAMEDEEKKMYLKNRGPELKLGKAIKEVPKNSQSWCRHYRDANFNSSKI